MDFALGTWNWCFVVVLGRFRLSLLLVNFHLLLSRKLFCDASVTVSIAPSQFGLLVPMGVVDSRYRCGLPLGAIRLAVLLSRKDSVCLISLVISIGYLRHPRAQASDPPSMKTLPVISFTEQWEYHSPVSELYIFFICGLSTDGLTLLTRISNTFPALSLSVPTARQTNQITPLVIYVLIHKHEC